MMRSRGIQDGQGNVLQQAYNNSARFRAGNKYSWHQVFRKLHACLLLIGLHRLGRSQEVVDETQEKTLVHVEISPTLSNQLLALC